MEAVTRILIAAEVKLAVIDEETPAAESSLEAYLMELGERLDNGFTASQADRSFTPYLHPRGRFLVALVNERSIGCGGLVFRSGYAEIKRMWVAKEYRGLGLGGRILDRLERLAVESGYPIIRLDTNATLEKAKRMYAKRGYTQINRYNDNPYADLWFEKRVTEGGEPGAVRE